MFGFTIDELADIRLECKTFHIMKLSEIMSLCARLCAKGKMRRSRADNSRLEAACKGYSSERACVGSSYGKQDITHMRERFRGGSQRQANLRALADRAMEASEGGIYDVYGFLKYIEAVKARKIEIGQIKTVGENDDVVRIMTIHKSKGLEFPVVIGAGMGSRFNFRNKERQTLRF